jgi:phospholipid/cholesterol/gamma-HCH transport system substrate-binding protein
VKRTFRERDPLRMGVAGLAVTVALVFAAFNLTMFEGGTDYKAAFTEASGLKPNEDVRIAGVKVGKVKSVGLEGDHVKVGFNLRSDVHFGTLSRVRIKLSTILGSHYLDVVPSGPRRQSPHVEIPTSRTTPSYEVVPALQDLSHRLTQIDVPQLSKAFDTLSATMSGSSDNVRTTLAGLQKVSRAIASRDDSLSDLLGHTRNVTRLLADRSGDLAALVSDGSLLLQEINARRGTIRSLLSGTISLSQQITATIQENQAALHPTLVQLRRVIGILERNQGNLDRAVQTLGPFVTTSADATASGRWFDGYLQNLIPLPVSIKPSATGTVATPRAGQDAREPGTTPTPGSGDPLPVIP